jgi:hypothetical protein
MWCSFRHEKRALVRTCPPSIDNLVISHVSAFETVSGQLWVLPAEKHVPDFILDTKGWQRMAGSEGSV